MRTRSSAFIALSLAGTAVIWGPNARAEEGKPASLEQRVEALEKRLNEGSSNPWHRSWGSRNLDSFYNCKESMTRHPA